LKKKGKEPRWIIQQQAKLEKQNKEEINAQRATGLFVRAGQKDSGEGVESRLGDDDGDANEVDFDEKEMFDDDEGDLAIEGEDEEDTKEAEKRMRREQLGANIFDLNDEKEVEEEEDKKEEFEKEQKKQEKSTRMALMEHEKNLTYEDSEDENPYTSEVSSYGQLLYFF
jgi:transcription initiation factor TFIIF subunit alpha